MTTHLPEPVLLTKGVVYINLDNLESSEKDKVAGHSRFQGLGLCGEKHAKRSADPEP